MQTPVLMRLGSRNGSPAVIGQLSWGVLSQALSSGGNFLCLILAARNGSAADLGAVASALTIYLVAIGSARSLLSEPLLIRHQDDRTEFGQRKSSTSAFYLGCLLSVALAFAQAILYTGGSRLRPELVWLSACLPFLLFLDGRRYQLFAINRPIGSAILDGSWVIVFLLGVALKGNPGSLGVWQCWCGSGATIGLIAIVQSRGLAGFRSSVSWLRSNLDLGSRFLAESLSSGLAVSLSLGLYSVRSGPLVVGSIRSAISLFGPLIVIYLGTQPTLLGIAQRSVADLRRVARISTGIMVFSAGVLTLLLLLLPDRVGREILGQTWLGARKQILLVGLATLASVSSTGAVLGLRALAAAGSSLRARLLSAPFAVLAPLSLGAVLGGSGFALGYATANIITSCLLWRAFHLERRARMTLDGLGRQPAKSLGHGTSPE